MRVLFASHMYPSPANPLLGVFVRELATAMADQAETEVVAPIGWRPFHKPIQPENGGTVRVSYPARIPLPAPLREIRWRTHLRALQHCGLKGPWDIIHSHWIDPDAMAVSRWKGSNASRLVASVHGHAALGEGIGGIGSSSIRKALHCQDHVVAVSSELRSLLVDRFGVSPEKTSVLFNGIDPLKFRFQDRTRARASLNLPVEQRIVLCVARLSSEKRLDVLMRAVANCSDRDFVVYVVGEGPLLDELRRMGNQLGLQDRVFLVGGRPHNELASWYGAADLLCLSSAHEGCPVVVHEAIACGLPVVSTRVGAVPDLIEKAEGELCEPNDIPSLSRSLSVALSRKWDRKKIAEKGSRYTWDAQARQLKTLYSSLIDNDC